MQGNSKNRQIITHSIVALIAFILGAAIFSPDVNLFGTASNVPVGPSGTLALIDGSAGTRALVEAYAPDGTISLEVADRDGNFTLTEFMPGNYVLIA